MGRLIATLAVLFFLFAFSYARTPLDFTVNDVSDRDLSSSLPVSDTKPTLLLPSEKPESDPTIVVELEPATIETKPLDMSTDAEAVGTAEDLPVFDTQAVDEVPLNRPLTIGRLRPINRHFPAKRPYPFRGCRHGIKPMMNPRVHGPEVSYGDDMILASESKDFDPAPFLGGVHQIPARWVRFHHHHHRHEGMPRFPFSRRHDMFAQQRFRRPFRSEEEEEREEKKGREERDEGGFMRHFRKFLNHKF